MPAVPLNEEFPGASSGSKVEAAAYSLEPEVTKLENGMRVVTLQSPYHILVLEYFAMLEVFGKIPLFQVFLIFSKL